MPKPKAPIHVHKYSRKNIAAFGSPEYLVFYCTLPLCTSYVPLKLAEGKMCECNRCGELMIINRESIQHAKPHCSNCIKRKTVKDEDVNAIAAFLQKMESPETPTEDE